jgi:hypothetical protein
MLAELLIDVAAGDLMCRPCLCACSHCAACSHARARQPAHPGDAVSTGASCGELVRVPGSRVYAGTALSDTCIAWA